MSDAADGDDVQPPGTLTPDQWRHVVDSLTLPSFAEIVDAVQNARDVPVTAAESMVDTAIASGVLTGDESTLTRYSVTDTEDDGTDETAPDSPVSDATADGSDDTQDTDDVHERSVLA